MESQIYRTTTVVLPEINSKYVNPTVFGSPEAKVAHWPGAKVARLLPGEAPGAPPLKNITVPRLQRRLTSGPVRDPWSFRKSGTSTISVPLVMAAPSMANDQ